MCVITLRPTTKSLQTSWSTLLQSLQTLHNLSYTNCTPEGLSGLQVEHLPTFPDVAQQAAS